MRRHRDSDPPQTTPDVGSASAMLRGAGLRRTPVRLGVLEVLGSSGGQPVGVPQVLEKLPADTDAVTVYRTLNTFTRKGLVHRVRGEDRSWRYALGAYKAAAEGQARGHGPGKEAPAREAAAAHGHPHFVCDGCGAVECLEKSQIPRDFVRSLRVAARYDVRYPEVVLHGLCPRCNA